MRATVLVLVVSALATLAFASEHSYSRHDPVPVIVNNVGPFNNPAETYEFYTLPYCAPEGAHTVKTNIGEVLSGDRRTSSLYDIRYNTSEEWRALCDFELNQEEIKWFTDAIKQNYIFEMFIDELPVKGFVGMTEIKSEEYDHHTHKDVSVYLFTHLDFSIAYNGPHIIAVNLTTDHSQRVKLQYGASIPVQFSYSVHWHPINVPFADRMDEHLKHQTHDQSVEIHWLSIVNSFVLVILLTSFLAIILMRILKKDIAAYMEDEEQMNGTEDDEESGWKLVHGDVFRAPENLMFFAAAIGQGTQIFAMVMSILILSMVGTFYAGNRGALYTAAIVLYALTASIAGYVSSSLYAQLGGTKWATNAMITASLFAGPLFFVFSLLNSVAISYGSTSALPFKTIFVIILLWGLVTFPLTVIGSMRGHKNAGKFDAPCKTNRVPREIPAAPWYRSAVVQMFMAGFLPFSAIYIELHYIFASVWGHRAYTLFGILFLAFVMLIIVTAFITVALTYFQLAIEDYRWWWRSFVSGGSTGVFIYMYAAFFYSYRSDMSGALQASFFFGYMLLISYAFFLMLGSIGFWASSKFVRYIYGSIKID